MSTIFKTITINSNTHTNIYMNKSKFRLTHMKWTHIWPVCGHGNWFQLYTLNQFTCIHVYFYVCIYMRPISSAKILFSELPTTWIKVPDIWIAIRSVQNVQNRCWFICLRANNTTQYNMTIFHTHTCKIRFQFIHSQLIATIGSLEAFEMLLIVVCEVCVCVCIACNV